MWATHWQEPDSHALDNLTGQNDTECLTYSTTASGRLGRQCQPDHRLPPGALVLVRRGAPIEWRLGVVKVSYNGSFMVEVVRASGDANATIAQAEAAEVLDLGQFSVLQAGDHVLAKVSTRLLPVQARRLRGGVCADVDERVGKLAFCTTPAEAALRPPSRRPSRGKTPPSVAPPLCHRRSDPVVSS
ncbi:unnamed protein product [Prorocentrum cordatum]|uniref:Uncharacterized protein n=1 Tax=Prorocentrum cordatum TaxID=2364126 RepID=A0ABN9V6F2_9DINO|nr:unnamed protein product [Polarella glacialis]